MEAAEGEGRLLKVGGRIQGSGRQGQALAYLRESLLNMRHIKKSVEKIEVDHAILLRKLPVCGPAGIPISEQYILRYEGGRNASYVTHEG